VKIYRYLKLLGSILVLISLFYLGHKIWDYKHTLLSLTWSPQIIALVLLSIAIYAASLLLISTAWCYFLHYIDRQKINYLRCHIIYGCTNIAKYIPGNVFHYLGRQWYGKHHYSQLALAGASFNEIVGIILGAGSIALIGIFTFETSSILVSAGLVSSILIIAFLVLIAINILLPKIAQKFNIKDYQEYSFQPSGNFFIPFFLYLLFFLISGTIVCSLAILNVDNLNIASLGQIVTVYSLAWVVGFVTPGAPGGIGVREILIVSALAGITGEFNSLLIAILFRIITICGDLFFFIITSVIDKKVGLLSNAE